MYKFEIEMKADETFNAYVWDVPSFGVGNIVHSIFRVTEQEAEDWIEKRAMFLDKNTYQVTKTFGP